MNVSECWAPLLKLVRARREVLLCWLADRAIAEGMSLNDLGAETGVPANYLRLLYMNRRQVKFLSNDVAQAFAHFLGVSVIQVRFAAGEIRLDDFYTEDGIEEASWSISLALNYEELMMPPSVVTAFAAVLRNINYPSRATLRDWVADGPLAVRL